MVVSEEPARALDIEDAAALRRYLLERGATAPRDVDTLRIDKLPGGVSNRTMKVVFPEGRAWVLKQALPRLRVAVDWFADPARAHREALAIRALAGICPAGSVPRLVFEDESLHLLAMEAVPDPHENWKTMLLRGTVEQSDVRQFAALLGAIHSGGYRDRARLTDLFSDRSHFQSLRLEPYYAYSAAQVPEARAFLESLIDETGRTILTLVHGDFSPKNILVHDSRLVLLDHEVIHFGDPGFDVGFALTHLLSKAHHLPGFRSRLRDAARMFWTIYSDAIAPLPWSADLEPRAVRHTLGCLLARVAGRSQLEYLSSRERERQRDVVVRLMAAPPARIAGLADEFLERIEEES